GNYNRTSGVYTISGTPAVVTTALDGLTFFPTAHQAASGQTVTTRFTINVTDIAQALATDGSTSVTTPETASPPSVLSGAPRTARSPRGCKSHQGNGRLAQ